MVLGILWVRDDGERTDAVDQRVDRRLGTDRRRILQRTVVVSDVSYATVYLVRHALPASSEQRGLGRAGPGWAGPGWAGLGRA